MTIRNKITIAVILYAVLAVIANAAQTRAKTVYKLFHLNETEVGIVCRNGADPTGTKVGDMVIISCGK